jgi:DNA polymerase-3 subunit delta'
MSIASVIAQDAACDKLQQAIRSERIPHAYIFHGPAGVGKELCAREFAKLILCQNRKKRRQNKQDVFDCCDACPSCRQIEADTHPDFHLVYRQQIHELRPQQSDQPDDAPSPSRKTHQATALAVDVIREKLNKPARLTSTYGRGKVFVVREIHLANVQAQNALLKTLEEPPKGTVLILLADKIEGLLPTVLSRCQLVMFGPLPQDFLLDRLAQAGYEPAESAFWARFSQGSLGRALWLAAQQWHPIKLDLLKDLARLTDRDVVDLAERIIVLAKAYPTQARKDEPAISDTVAKQRMYSFLLAVASAFYRDIMVYHSGADPSAWINTDQQSLLTKAATRMDLLSAGRAVSLVGRAEYLILSNVNANLVLEDLFGDLAAMNAPPVGGKTSSAGIR